MSEITRRQFSCIAGATALAAPAVLGCTSVWADTFPSRTVTIVVPFQPGGSNDIIARLVAQRMTELGAEFVPDSKLTPDGLRSWLRAETERWGTVIRAAGQYAD